LRTVLEAATSHAGAIRIDHAMGLHRLFWIPQGMGAADGCYVLYPMADMLRAVADASVSQRAVIIGEDLGTVPKGFPEAMQSTRMMSSRVLYFEWARSGFRARASYPRNAFISVSTHDLPPLASWWHAGDAALFESLGVIDAAEARRSTRQRKADRRKLIDRLRRDLPKRLVPAAFQGGTKKAADAYTQEVAVAVHAFLARTPSLLFGIQFEDLCGADMPVNVPGTWKEYPNWQLRARATIEDAPETPLWTAIVGAAARERKR
jgi:4-alpha-glucanotransferase